jgi:hypothetical protein
MHLQRCQDQPSKTLDQFYQNVVEHDGYGIAESGQAMLELIAGLRGLQNQWHVWGLTSHTRLCLLAHDTSASPWYVIVSALASRDYAIEYLMPAAVAPWTRAYVQGEARSTGQAIEMVIIAMRRSEGWPDMDRR